MAARVAHEPADLYAPAAMPTVAEPYFEASDAALQGTRRTWWGTVVTDDRFPDVYDLNYARVTEEAADLTLTDVVEELEPLLRPAGSRHLQITVMHPGGAPALVEEAVAAGLRVSTDSVMELRREVLPPAGAADGIERADPAGDLLWRTLRDSYREFDVTQPHVVEQLLRWNREVLAPAGRRHFLARRDGRVAGMGALQVADGIAYVDDIVTFPEFRRRGVASAIVARLVREAAAFGAGATFLLADEAGPIRLYRSLGFEETGTIRTLLGHAPWADPAPV
jgi:ribosomal protein S18 acetylase RimI-like enzyme